MFCNPNVNQKLRKVVQFIQRSTCERSLRLHSVNHAQKRLVGFEKKCW